MKSKKNTKTKIRELADLTELKPRSLEVSIKVCKFEFLRECRLKCVSLNLAHAPTCVNF